ncbi:hypothetical protein [Thalassoroseus pseudoceratinae]|uniref:hypothetical protein n=1 Tax=Thalassoroseus pseudoceratinae TaxID=2713176 RepID=UPI00141EF04A|nr:hypothetical protein [Thalassoroseus pseudoceratinae]
MTLHLSPLLITLALSLLSVPLLKATTAARGTTLTGAVGWAWAAWLAWTSTWIIEFTRPSATMLTELGWYAATLLSVCPALFILGAKRPGSRVWTVFVVVPFLLVFTWPILADWVRDSTLRSFQLELPMRLGYALVLVMGFGNYVGTRWTIPAIVIGIACGWVMWTFDGRAFEAGIDNVSPIRTVPVCLLCIAGLLIWGISRQPNVPKSGLDRFWESYRNAFGVVWAVRFMERVNAMAEKEQWVARWELDRIVWQEATAEEREETAQKMEATVRWLGRRFANPEWIDRQLQTVETTVPSTDSAAS